MERHTVNWTGNRTSSRCCRTACAVASVLASIAIGDVDGGHAALLQAARSDEFAKLAKQKPGGGVFVLESPFSETPGATDLLGTSTVGDGRLAGTPLAGGAFVSLDVDYDARSLAFAWTEAKRTLRQGPIQFVTHWDKDSTFHIFSVNADGTALTQLTDAEMHRFVLWLDTNCMFYGAYRETEKQLAGELVTPLIE